MYLAVILLVLSLITNVGAQLIVRRMNRKREARHEHRRGQQPVRAIERVEAAQAHELFMECVGTAASLLAVAVLLIVFSVFKQARRPSAGFLNQTPSSSVHASSYVNRRDRQLDRRHARDGGNRDVIAVPVGILAAIFTTEFARPSSGRFGWCSTCSPASPRSSSASSSS